MHIELTKHRTISNNINISIHNATAMPYIQTNHIGSIFFYDEILVSCKRSNWQIKNTSTINIHGPSLFQFNTLHFPNKYNKIQKIFRIIGNEILFSGEQHNRYSPRLRVLANVVIITTAIAIFVLLLIS